MLPMMRDRDANVAKYANTAIPAMVEALERGFAVKRRALEARISGGATMFAAKKRVKRLMDIGNNNIKAVRYCLEQLRIPIRGEDLGADYGRRMEFRLETGVVSVRAAGQTIIEL